MNLIGLNPFIRTAAVYQKVAREGVRCAYDARLFFVLSGGLSVTVGEEKARRLSPGNLLYIPAGVPYQLKCDYARFLAVSFDLTEAYCDEAELLAVPVTEFDASRVHTFESLPFFASPIFAEDMTEERETLEALAGLFRAENGEYRVKASALLKGTLVRLYESCDEHALPPRMHEALDEYIRENAGEEISNTELGAIFGYHPFYISQMLKKKRGITLRQYVIRYRMRSAAELLALSKMPIAEIAEECGFTDASYFTKAFKTEYGMTPKAYRQAQDDKFI